MEKNKFVLGGVVCAVMLIIVGAYFLLRPDFKVYSSRVTYEINAGYEMGRYNSPNPSELNFMIITVRVHHRGEILNTDFNTIRMS